MIRAADDIRGTAYYHNYIEDTAMLVYQDI
jgi:hypothetical protein